MGACLGTLYWGLAEQPQMRHWAEHLQVRIWLLLGCCLQRGLLDSLQTHRRLDE